MKENKLLLPQALQILQNCFFIVQNIDDWRKNVSSKEDFKLPHGHRT